MTPREEQEFAEAVAKAMCRADGLDPDEYGPAIPSRILTAGENSLPLHAGREILPLAVPNWRNYRREAMLVIAATNEMWAVASRIVDRRRRAEEDEKKDTDEA